LVRCIGARPAEEGERQQHRAGRQGPTLREGHHPPQGTSYSITTVSVPQPGSYA
jgi:hypothetical protein